MNKLTKMICLALAGPAALAGAANADTAGDTYRIEFRYNAGQTAVANYRTFERAAKNTCETRGRRPIEVMRLERACVTEIMDKVVVAMGRTDLALLHFNETGRPAVAPRDFAAIDK